MRDDFLVTLRFWADRGVDGFRVDVAHALAKDLSEPLRSKPTLEDHPSMPTDGTDPLYDRDEVHEIYREWREVFDSYDPPRTAVAEACAPSSRRALYARPTELGQAFNFDLLQADYDARTFRDAITFCLSQAAASGSSSTWVLSNHDVVRHATRYALPSRHRPGRVADVGRQPAPCRRADRSPPGPCRDRADAGPAGVVVLLPGRGAGPARGRRPARERARRTRSGCAPRTRRRAATAAGCRCPGTTRATRSASAAATAWLPQPAGFSRTAVAAQEGRTGTTLEFYREALRVRRQLQTGEALTWVETDDPEVLHFTRPGGWHCLSNFGTTAVPLPDGVVRLSSGQHVAGVLPPETTVWLTEWEQPRD